MLLCSFLRSVSTADLLTAFTGEVWAYRCTACAQTFRRPGKGLVGWRGKALSIVDDGLYAAISTLDEVLCNSKAGVDSLGMPLGMCDRCYCKTKRARRQGGRIETGMNGKALPPPHHRSLMASSASGMGVQAGPHTSRAAETTVTAPPRFVHIAPRPRTACRDSEHSFDGSMFGAGPPRVCDACLSVKERIAQLGRDVDEARRLAVLERRRTAELHTRLMTALAVPSPVTTTPTVPETCPVPPSCTIFLEELRCGAYWNDRDEPVLQVIAATISLRSSPPEIRFEWENGVERVYKRHVTHNKTVVSRSQRYKRLATRLQLFTDSVGAEAHAAVAGGKVSVSVAPFHCLESRRRSEPQPISRKPEQQLRLIAACRVSLTAYNGIRRGIRAFGDGLASLPVLRAARIRLFGLPAERVTITSSGAHFSSLKGAVQEKLDALWASNRFTEGLLRDEDLKTIPQTLSYEVPAEADCGTEAASPAANVKDIHLTLGVDKRGTPSSVKIVAGLANQSRPHKLNNTILVGECPAEKDKYEEVSGMLGEHLGQVAELVHEGVVVGGVRRAVRWMPSGDYEALSTVHGHRGPSETMPCLMWYCTKAPSVTHAGLDAVYGTLRDVDDPAVRYPRTSAHLVTMTTLGAPGCLPGGLLGDSSQAARRSIERRSPFTVDPRQIVPIPLHILLGNTLRLLRLAIELIISCRGRGAGLTFAYGLAETSRLIVRVCPAPHNGGVSIGRDCQTITEASEAVCRTLVGLVAEKDHAAYRRLWVLWKTLARTMNRAALVHTDESNSIRSNAQSFVRHMKRSFPWVNVSSKLHILMCQAPDFLDRFGSIVLCGEQFIEAWHKYYAQNAAKYAAGTEVEACANLARAVAVSREASDSHLIMPMRKPAKDGARRARKSGDGRKRENKGGSGECGATREKSVKEERK